MTATPPPPTRRRVGDRGLRDLAAAATDEARAAQAEARADAAAEAASPGAL